MERREGGRKRVLTACVTKADSPANWKEGTAE